LVFGETTALAVLLPSCTDHVAVRWSGLAHRYLLKLRIAHSEVGERFYTEFKFDLVRTASPASMIMCDNFRKFFCREGPNEK
jgi:hypothetical protein